MIRNLISLEVPNVVTTTYVEGFTGLEFHLEPIPSPIIIPYFGLPAVPQPYNIITVTDKKALFIRDLRTTYCQGGEPQAPAGTGWELYINNCEGRRTATFARRNTSIGDFAGLIGVVTTCAIPSCIPPNPATIPAFQLLYPNAEWQLIGTSNVPIPFLNTYYWIDWESIPKTEFELNNGRPLVDVLNFGLNTIGCEQLDVQSQFLTNPINPVTSVSPSSTDGIQMHSISDIKDPNASEPATREDITVKEILDNYCSSKLNNFWTVDERTKRLIVEHYNDLNNGNPIDLTAIDGGKWLRNRNTLEYDNTDIPRAEEFPSQDSTIDFTGVDILYDNNCAEGVKTFNTDKFYSEVELIVSDPETYPSDGVVMITPDSLDPNGAAIENGAITGDYLPNVPQGMANLHNKFWKFYRPFPQGELNFNNEAFSKNRPVKKMQTVTVPWCCFFFFNPRAAFIGTNFTEGQLQSASYNPKTNFITLEIQYDE